MKRKKPRKHITKEVAESVLDEFRHRCAICGADRPQLHHIDEDPSNNEPLNLLPLCPNCHLNDQHNPTASPDPDRLLLFRIHKDPAILHHKFYPLWIRARYLLDVDSRSAEQLSGLGKDLAEFVGCLAMGNFYGQKIYNLACKIPSPTGSLIDMNQLIQTSKGGQMVMVDDLMNCLKWNVESDEKYHCVMRVNREIIFVLITELLRYQDWS